MPPPCLPRRARVRLVVLVPVGDVLDAVEREVDHLVFLRDEVVTVERAEEDDRDRAMGPVSRVPTSTEDADELVDPPRDAGFLRDLTHDRFVGVLVRVDPAGQQAETSVVGAVGEEDAVVVVEDRGVGADLRADVAEVVLEPRAHCLGFQ